MCECYQNLILKNNRHLVGIVPDEQIFYGQTYLTGLSVKQTKDGKKRSPLMFNYCPFCGEKYKRLNHDDFVDGKLIDVVNKNNKL